MICVICSKRYAPFPEEDFVFIPGIGFVPKTPEAEIKRENLFISDKPGDCSPECEETADMIFINRQY